MYMMLRQRSASALLTDQTPPLVAALLVAEFFYKFHSFTLECIAFLATWFVLDWVWTKVRGIAGGSVSPS